MRYLSFTLIIFLFSCSSSIAPVDDGLENQIFHFGNGSEPQGIDPHIVTGVPEHHILISLCEGLTIPNAFDDDNLPGSIDFGHINFDPEQLNFDGFRSDILR